MIDLMRITKEQFAEWLKTSEGKNLTFLPRSCSRCPLACFLNSIHPQPDSSWEMSSFGFAMLDEGRFATPEWMDKFIEQVDLLEPQWEHGYGNTWEIGAHRALNVLETIP